MPLSLFWTSFLTVPQISVSFLDDECSLQKLTLHYIYSEQKDDFIVKKKVLGFTSIYTPKPKIRIWGSDSWGYTGDCLESDIAVFLVDSQLLWRLNLGPFFRVCSLSWSSRKPLWRSRTTKSWKCDCLTCGAVHGADATDRCGHLTDFVVRLYMTIYEYILRFTSGLALPRIAFHFRVSIINVDWN